MSRTDLLVFTGISRTVLEARIRVLVGLLDAIGPQLGQNERDLVDRAVRAQVDREQAR